MWRVTALRETIQAVQPDVVLSFLSSTNIITVAAGYGLPYRIVISERNDPTRQEDSGALAKSTATCLSSGGPNYGEQSWRNTGIDGVLRRRKLAYVANPIAITDDPSSDGRTASILFLARLIPQKAPDVLVTPLPNSPVNIPSGP